MTCPPDHAATFSAMANEIHAVNEDGITTITIDRAPVNALGPDVWGALASEVRAANDDPDIRTVIVTGAAGRFCAGADIQILTEPGDEPALMLRVVDEASDAIRACRVPVLAAIDGPAHGGGLELALACDIRVASAGATFAASGVNMGLVASIQSLVAVIGDARARSMLLTGKPIDASQAERWGLVTHLDDAPLSAAVTLARVIASKAPLSIEATKQALRSATELTATEHTTLMTELFSTLAQTSDHREAIDAFLGKRPPTFGRS